MSIRPLERPKFQFERLSFYDERGGRTVYLAGRIEWIPILIESETEPSGSIKYLYDDIETWQIEDIYAVSKISDNIWKCSYSNAKQIIGDN